MSIAHSFLGHVSGLRTASASSPARWGITLRTAPQTAKAKSKANTNKDSLPVSNIIPIVIFEILLINTGCPCIPLYTGVSTVGEHPFHLFLYIHVLESCVYIVHIPYAYDLCEHPLRCLIFCSSLSTRRGTFDMIW